MEFLQPQIIKFNNNERLPELVQGKYFIYYTLSGLFDNDAIHAIYVNLDSVDKLHTFISNINETDITLLFTGDNTFALGKDYFINEALYKSLVQGIEYPVMPIDDELEETPEIIPEVTEVPVDEPTEAPTDAPTVEPEPTPTPTIERVEINDLPDVDEEMFVESLFFLPNYMTTNGINIEYFDYVDNYETLFNYFKKKNEYTELAFDEMFLRDFYVNFMTMILELSVYTPTDNIDYIYKQVMNYFAEYQSDDVYMGMSLIFNTLYGTAQSSSVNCGCNNNASMDAICTTSCNDYYKNAMIEYVKQLFGDYTFYQKWFFVTSNESGVKQVNQLLVDKLRLFIKEFLLLDINIGTTNDNNKNCMCPTVDLTSDKCNRGILNNFLNILNFIEMDKIEENSNRIKVYGEEFGKIYPLLQF